MLWRIPTIALALGLVVASYLWYCRAFWDEHYSDRQKDYYDFHSTVSLPPDSALGQEDLLRYTWTRTILEPQHGQWINETELRFPNDSTMEVTVRPGYVQDNYLLYPIFRRPIVSDPVMRETYALDKERLVFPSRWRVDGGPDSIAIELKRGAMTIDYSFL